MGDLTDAGAVVQAYWDRLQARDWAGVADLLAAGVVLDWPVTDERITGISAVVAVNREYPQGWSVRVLREVAQGDQVASEVEVPHEGLGTFRVASFWTVRDGLVEYGREYWTSPGADPAPAWRAPYVLPLSVADQE